MGFKVGDRVRVVNNLEGTREKYRKKVGKIAAFWGGSGYNVMIQFDDASLNTCEVGSTIIDHLSNGYKLSVGDTISGHLFEEHEVVKPIKATKLAKKMYPKKIEENGWLI